MSHNINQSEDPMQGQSEDIERFVLFRFQGSLGNGVKGQIKSHGCIWNHMYHGWLCPLNKQKTIQNIIEETKIEYDSRTVPLPKGMIASDPKIACRQTRLDILEEEAYKAGRQLLEDVYRYNISLRPEDFAKAASEEGKNITQIQTEVDFHTRWISIEKMKNDAASIRKELSQLNEDPGAKILDHQAPLQIAEALIHKHYLHKQHRTLQYCSDSFWRWNGVKYVELDEDEIRQIIYTFLSDAKELNSSGHLENFNPTKHKVDQVADALRAICYLKHHPASGALWLDDRDVPDPKYLISFRNGLLSLEDWLKDPTTPLIPHTPVLLNVNSLNFDFDLLAAKPNAWFEFLGTIWEDDEESQLTLQEWCGYILTQDTRQHKILLVIGPPRSGKGTIGRILLELLGHFNVVGPTLSSLSGEFGLQPLLNQMLALISDARLNGKGNNCVIIERLLSISGEDPLTVNRKFLPPLTVQLPTRIMMMSNELPDMRDPSGAIAKRYLVLTLKKSWLGKEDISLFSRLKEELPGILLWALQGLVRLEKRGYFLQPTSSSQTIEELEAMTSPIKAFISDRCEITPLARVSVPDLFGAWQDWCGVNGHQKFGNVQSFGKNLRAAFPEIQMNRPQEGLHRERCYIGIKLA
jgi:putative DNA primase/helicase